MGAPAEATRTLLQEAFYHGADICYLIEDAILKRLPQPALHQGR